MHKESQAIIEQLEIVIQGKTDVLQRVWITLLAGGHVLLEDLPGVGKTTLAKAIGKVVSLQEKRLQLTPDTMASDITGFMMYNQQQNAFFLKEGSVMTNVLLADELNRTSTRTQAALLEAMQEKQVTIDERTYALPKPFHVIATQNPAGSAGTQALPLAQLDRFMTRLSIGYPSVAAQIALLKNYKQTTDTLQPVATKDMFLSWQQDVCNVYIEDTLYAYVTALTEASRQHEAIQYGISPRGALALCQYARARAFFFGRLYVTPEDIQRSFLDVCSHRIATYGEAAAAVLTQILQQVPSPDDAYVK